MIPWFIVYCLFLPIDNSAPTSAGLSVLPGSSFLDQKSCAPNRSLRQHKVERGLRSRWCHDVTQMPTFQVERVEGMSRRQILAGSGLAMILTPLSTAWAAELTNARNNSRRVGGLANKIRGICRTMVRSPVVCRHNAMT
jgi:hypothetical protein